MAEAFFLHCCVFRIRFFRVELHKLFQFFPLCQRTDMHELCVLTSSTIERAMIFSKQQIKQKRNRERNNERDADQTPHRPRACCQRNAVCACERGYHASAAPIARPQRVQIACGMILRESAKRSAQSRAYSPKNRTAVTEITMEMMGFDNRSRKIGNASFAAALQTSSVTEPRSTLRAHARERGRLPSSKWCRFTSGMIRCARFRSAPWP
jgi:hypothetical protein